jgi:peptide/nickel transport system substrate-binding protein
MTLRSTSGEPTATFGRRPALRLLVGGASVALLAACGPSSSPAPAPTAPPVASGPTAAATTAARPAATSAPTSVAATAPTQPASQPAAAQPRMGGTLRVGIPTDIATLDGHLSSSLLSITHSMAYDRLVAYDVKATPRPRLAESWDVAPDRKQIKLNLRKGVTWHSGREFTSDDVKWNLLRGQDPKAATGSYVNQAKWFPDIETPDKYTVVMTSEVSRPAIFDYFNVLNMIDRQTIEGPDAKSTVVGTGPFKFVEWVQGDHLSYTRNPNYWRGDFPYLDGITVNVVRDSAAMSTRVEAGALDAIYGLPIAEFLRFRDDANFRALIPPGQKSGMAMGVNTLFPPMDNRKFRQALSYAADRQRYVDQIYHGITKPLFLPWDSNSLAYEAAKENPYPFDLDKARSLMQEVGVTSAEFDFLASPDNPEWELASQIYQSDLAKIGIKLNLVKLDQAAWLSQVNNRRYNGFWGSTMAVGTGEPVSGLSLGRATDPNSNNEGYKNDTYAQLIASAAAEPDATRRKALYSQINDILIEDCFVMPVTTYPPKMVTSRKVHDLVTEDSTPTFFWLENVWLEP